MVVHLLFSQTLEQNDLWQLKGETATKRLWKKAAFEWRKVHNRRSHIRRLSQTHLSQEALRDRPSLTRAMLRLSPWMLFLSSFLFALMRPTLLVLPFAPAHPLPVLCALVPSFLLPAFVRWMQLHQSTRQEAPLLSSFNTSTLNMTALSEAGVNITALSSPPTATELRSLLATSALPSRLASAHNLEHLPTSLMSSEVGTPKTAQAALFSLVLSYSFSLSTLLIPLPLEVRSLWIIFEIGFCPPKPPGHLPVT